MYSKVKNLKHPILKIQQYLTSNNKNMRKEDCPNILKMRCRMTKIKLNMGFASFGRKIEGSSSL